MAVSVIVPLAASCWAERSLGHHVARLRIGPWPFEDHPTVEPGEVVGVREPHVDDGQTARGEVPGQGDQRLALGGPAAQQQDRIERDERQRIAAGIRQRQAEKIGFDERQAARRDGRGPGSLSGPIQHRAVDVDRSDRMPGGGEGNREAAAAGREFQDSTVRARRHGEI
ncbi:MAG: hypothetical protein WKF78_13640 [Candidatus Limnocylindrales bacterium]